MQSNKIEKNIVLNNQSYSTQKKNMILKSDKKVNDKKSFNALSKHKILKYSKYSNKKQIKYGTQDSDSEDITTDDYFIGVHETNS